jgi:hypothetical protein
VELIVQPDAHDFSGKVGVDHHGLGKWRAGRSVTSKYVDRSIAEVNVEIFSFDGPLRSKYPFDPATYRPTGSNLGTAAGPCTSVKSSTNRVIGIRTRDLETRMPRRRLPPWSIEVTPKRPINRSLYSHGEY